MTRPFINVRTERLGDAAVVRVTGEVDLSTADQLEQAVDDAMKLDPSRLVFDLLDVGFLDSSGLSVLLRARSKLPDDRPVALVVGEGVVEVVLETTAMSKVFSIVDSLERALGE